MACKFIVAYRVQLGNGVLYTLEPELLSGDSAMLLAKGKENKISIDLFAKLAIHVSCNQHHDMPPGRDS